MPHVVFRDQFQIEYFLPSCFTVVSCSELSEDVANVNKVDYVL